ncbi:helix-turn-helix domain-containing protein [Hyphomicrobium sp. DY-1]|uniref:helix-turn-helix domain-containing protein n=1 Tax=Hyphomicrobium sp. DY-1 TaxID=3075650 RepID=UPI0039C03ECA
MNPRIPRKFIAEKTAEAFGFSFEELVSARRSVKLTLARRAAWLLIKEFRPDSSTSAIGLLCNRDHSTIVVGLQKGRARSVSDEEFRTKIRTVREILLLWPDVEPSAIVAQRPASVMSIQPAPPAKPETKPDPTIIAKRAFSARWWAEVDAMSREARTIELPAAQGGQEAVK